MVTIVPSILEKDPTSFEVQLKKVWGVVDRVQIDIIDGRFAEMETVGPEVLADIDTIVEFDAHLMVEKPENWIERCVSAGVIGIIGQVEKMEDKTKFVADTQAAGLNAGLGYDIDTPLDGLEEIIHDLDMVLLMSVKAGAQGREFDERVFQKIKQVRKMSKTVKIIIDGGLDVEKIKKCFEAEWAEEIAEDELNKSFAGMEFAVGSKILTSEDPKLTIENFRNLVA